MNLVEHVENSIQLAEQHKSKCDYRVLNLDGMSSPKVRHLLNNLCNREDTRYLEVGVWAGSTFCSALYENPIIADAIDNFSEFGGPKAIFERETLGLLGENRFTFHEARFEDVLPNLEPKINTYFYDGHHSYESQKNAMIHFGPCLAKEFVVIVDDWIFDGVKPGTYDGIKEAGHRILRSWELSDGWWNGLFVAVLENGHV